MSPNDVHTQRSYYKQTNKLEHNPRLIGGGYHRPREFFPVGPKRNKKQKQKQKTKTKKQTNKTKQNKKPKPSR